MWDFLHGYPTEGICHGTDQYNSCKDGAEILDHKVENFLPAEGLSILRDFFLHFLQTDYFGDKQADCDSCNRHHDRVGQKIEKVKELHADNGDVCQRSIAQAGEGSKEYHDDSHKDGCFFFGSNGVHLQK